jgi:hypothetical protein
MDDSVEDWPFSLEETHRELINAAKMSSSSSTLSNTSRVSAPNPQLTSKSNITYIFLDFMQRILNLYTHGRKRAKDPSTRSNPF